MKISKTVLDVSFHFRHYKSCGYQCSVYLTKRFSSPYCIEAKFSIMFGVHLFENFSFFEWMATHNVVCFFPYSKYTISFRNNTIFVLNNITSHRKLFFLFFDVFYCLISNSFTFEYLIITERF